MFYFEKSKSQPFLVSSDPHSVHNALFHIAKKYINLSTLLCDKKLVLKNSPPPASPRISQASGVSPKDRGESEKAVGSEKVSISGGELEKDAESLPGGAGDIYFVLASFNLFHF